MHNWIKRHKDRIPVYVVVIASVLFGYMVYIRKNWPIMAVITVCISYGILCVYMYIYL